MATLYKKREVYEVAYKLRGGKRQYVHGIRTLAQAKQVKALKDVEEMQSRLGLRGNDPLAEKFAAAGRQPISEHVKNFADNIRAEGAKKQHAHQQAAHVTRLLAMARIRSVSDIALEPLQKSLRKLLGPRCGPRTCNAARQAVIQFERFLVRTHKARHAVLQNLARFNEQEDVRRQRRALTQEEVDWLLNVTRKARDRTSRQSGIKPADRAMLYAVGMGTGYRRGALLQLTKSCFVVAPDVTRPLIRLAARFNKNGKDRNQPLRRDLAEQLSAWLQTKPDTGPVWHPLPYADPALWFRRDLEAARKAWIAAASDEAVRLQREESNTLKYVFHDGVRNVYADFHGLRHTGITFVVRQAGIRVGQVWADHSTPLLTARYAEVNEDDLALGLQGLPATSAATDRPVDGKGGRIQ